MFICKLGIHVEMKISGFSFPIFKTIFFLVVLMLNKLVGKGLAELWISFTRFKFFPTWIFL